MPDHYFRSVVISILTCLVLHIPTGHPLFEDQIGVFDWTQKLIGNVIFVEQNLLTSSGLYFFGSERNVIAAVFAENGSIAWRHVLENDGILKSLLLCERTLISISSIPNPIVRAWQASSGSVSWEKILEGTDSPVCQCGSLPNTLLCSAENALLTINIHTGKLVRLEEPASSGTFSAVHFVSPAYNHNETHKRITVLGTEPTGLDLTKLTLVFPTDSVTRARVLEKTSIHTPHHWGRKLENCVTVTSQSDATQMFLVCVFPDEEEHGNVLASLPLSGKSSEWLSIHLSKGASRLHRLSQSAFAISSASGAVYGVNSSGIPFIKFPIPQALLTSLSTFNNRDYLFVGHQEPNLPTDNFRVTIYDLNSGEPVSDFEAQRWTIAKHHGAVEAMYASLLRNPDGSLGFRLLLKTADHTIQLLHENNRFGWVREESLADIAAVELVDLPVSESQARMEEEFGHIHRNLLEMFVIRLRTQATQFVAFIKTALLKSVQLMDELILSYTSNTLDSTEARSTADGPLSSSSSANRTKHHHPTFTVPPRLIRGAPSATGHHDGTPSAKSDETQSFLTRDTFNLHKMIVIATAVGKVFGLESEKGRVVWEYLVPEVTLLTNGKLALFQQRNTAHFPLPPIATLLLRSKQTNLPVLFSFNPITGIPLERSGSSLVAFPTTDVIQAVLVPGPVGEHTDFTRPILLLDVNAKVHTYPPEYNQSWRSDVSPLYLYTVESASGQLTGYQVHSHTSEEVATTSRIWRMHLQSAVSNVSQAIVALATRPAAEHIHSVGRVLGDRTVLYKYLNPNLIAVLTASSGPTQSLTLYLIDVVAGRVVYSAVHRRCSEPVTLVFSENWILYTYYNHKSLRHEATVLELFEPMAGGEPCAAYSVPAPIHLFLQNLLPTGWFSTSQPQPEAESNARPLGHRRMQHVGSRALFSSLYRTTSSDGICRATGVSSLIPRVLQQSYIFTTAPIHGAAAVSLTERGITSKSIIFGLQKGALIELPKALFDPRREIDLTPELAEEGVHPYAPVLPLSDQAVISYNQSVMGIRAIRTAMTGLESTSLVFAYGLDLFFTRIAPSLTYDLLKEDFDYTAIATVTLGMVVASFVTQRLAARAALFRSWA